MRGSRGGVGEREEEGRGGRYGVGESEEEGKREGRGGEGRGEGSRAGANI